MCGRPSIREVAALKHVDRLTVRSAHVSGYLLSALEQIGVEVIFTCWEMHVTDFIEKNLKEWNCFAVHGVFRGGLSTVSFCVHVSKWEHRWIGGG